MKKLFFAALLAVTLAGSAFAADVNKINSVTLNSFKSEFKQASNVTWKTGADYAKATFTLNNRQMEAFYNLEGELIGSSKNISLDELPVNAKRNFVKQFNGYAVKEAIRFEGIEETGYYIWADNEKESIIVKIDESRGMSVFQRTKK